MILECLTGETHHCLRSIEVILVSSLSAARAVLLVLLAVLLLLLFLYRCGSTIGALCYWRRIIIQKGEICTSSFYIQRELNLYFCSSKNLTWWVFENERAEFVSGV